MIREGLLLYQPSQGISALYEPDPGTLRDSETGRKMTYFNKRGGNFRVEVVPQKGSGRLDTFKYEGERLIAEATGSDFDGAMLQTTMIGIQRGERVVIEPIRSDDGDDGSAMGRHHTLLN